MWERVAKTIKGRRVRMALVLLGGLAVYWFGFRLTRPPELGVVATYRGGKVTGEELRRYLHEFLPRCSKHTRCRRHGEEHEECSTDEVCERFLDCSSGEHAGAHRPTLYRRAAVSLIVDRLIAKRVAEKKLAERGETRHLMRHVGEDISLADLDRTLHVTEMRVEASEVREYYEKNRSRFGDRTLSEVTSKIEETLSREKEKGFLKDYVRRLKEGAVVSVSYDLLRWAEPSEAELRVLFAEKARSLVRPGRARVLLVSIPVASDKRQDLARKARAKLLGGAAQKEVAEILGEEPGVTVSVRWIEEDAPLARALQLSRHFPGETTDITAHGEARHVASILAREERRQMSFEEARAGLTEEVRKSAKKRFLKENSGATLFTVHGRPYSLGEFWREFQELSRVEQARYATFKERKKLLDRMIERAVLLEEASESTRMKKSRKQYDRIRTAVLRQILHQEEVDDQLLVSGEEARAFFEKHRRFYRRPARVKVSCIRITPRSSSAKDVEKAGKRAEAALKELKGSKVDEARFAEVARKYSDDPDVSRTGGKVEGWITETGDLVAELFAHQFHENVLGLKAGSLSCVFRMGHDFYVVWVRQREESGDRSFEETRGLVMQDLRARRHEEMTYKMEVELLQKAEAKVYDYTILEMIREESRHPATRGGEPP